MMERVPCHGVELLAVESDLVGLGGLREVPGDHGRRRPPCPGTDRAEDPVTAGPDVEQEQAEGEQGTGGGPYEARGDASGLARPPVLCPHP